MKRLPSRTEAEPRLGDPRDGDPGPPAQGPGPAPAGDVSALARLGRLVQRELTRRMAEAIDVGGEICLLEERA